MCLIVDFMKWLWAIGGGLVWDPVLSLLLGQAQVLAVTPSQGAGTPLCWDCPHPGVLMFSHCF